MHEHPRRCPTVCPHPHPELMLRAPSATAKRETEMDGFRKQVPNRLRSPTQHGDKLQADSPWTRLRLSAMEPCDGSVPWGKHLEPKRGSTRKESSTGGQHALPRFKPLPLPREGCDIIAPPIVFWALGACIYHSLWWGLGYIFMSLSQHL